MDNNAPKKIYLLCYGESREESGEDIFWCKDRVNDTDEEYYHVSEIERLRKALEDIEHETCTVNMNSSIGEYQYTINEIIGILQRSAKER